MERFVQFVVGGGLALVAGLWLVTRLSIGAPYWGVGAGLVCAGLAGLAAGIWRELDLSGAGE